MSIFKIFKRISSLPSILEGNSFYAVRTGVGYDLYLTDATGNFAHKLNQNIDVSLLLNCGKIPALQSQQFCVPYATNGSGLTTMQMTADRCYLMPFVVTRRLTITEIAVYATTQVSGCKIAFYSSSTTNYAINTKIFETQQFTFNNSLYTLNSNLTLEPALYYCALAASNTATFRALAYSASPCLAIQPDTQAVTRSYFYDTTNLTLPNNFTAIAVNNNTGYVPCVFVKHNLL